MVSSLVVYQLKIRFPYVLQAQPIFPVSLDKRTTDATTRSIVLTAVGLTTSAVSWLLSLSLLLLWNNIVLDPKIHLDDSQQPPLAGKPLMPSISLMTYRIYK